METYFSSKAVVFLENGDFINPGKFKYKLKKPMVVMVGAKFCHFCRDMAPDFNIFALQNKKKILSAVVQADGSPDERELARQLSQYAKFTGIPVFLIYDKNGNFIRIHKDGIRSLRV